MKAVIVRNASPKIGLKASLRDADIKIDGVTGIEITISNNDYPASNYEIDCQNTLIFIPRKEFRAFLKNPNKNTTDETTKRVLKYVNDVNTTPQGILFGYEVEDDRVKYIEEYDYFGPEKIELCDQKHPHLPSTISNLIEAVFEWDGTISSTSLDLEIFLALTTLYKKYDLTDEELTVLFMQYYNFSTIKSYFGRMSLISLIKKREVINYLKKYWGDKVDEYTWKINDQKQIEALTNNRIVKTYYFESSYKEEGGEYIEFIGNTSIKAAKIKTIVLPKLLQELNRVKV